VDFDNPPSKQLQEKYGFTITKQWLDHVRLSSVRFNDGGSGSFVSPRAWFSPIIMWRWATAKGFNPEKDYATDGFYARSAADEMKCRISS